MFTKTLRNLGLSLICCLSFAFLNPVWAQPTNLSLGDIAFTGYQADGSPDVFSFVLLVDINSGTSINFTENGWFSGGGFRSGEGSASWAAMSNLSCGTEVRIEGTSANTGMVVSNTIALSTGGDQLFAYQGLTPTAGDQSNFLAAIQMNGGWDGDATSASTSAQPSVFTDGVNSISISPEVDNAVYDCSTVGNDPATIRMAVNTAANWTTNNGPGLSFPAGCSFSCGAAAIPNLVITEIMQNPSAVFDSDGEWFEVYNAGNSPVDMNGMVIRDDGSNSHTIASSLIVPPGGYVVLAENGNMGTNGGVTADYDYPSSFVLSNGADEVIIELGDGTLIDRVDYDGGPGFPDPNGASMQLNPGAFNSTDNDAGANWCESVLSFGDGDLGTPGAANTVCGATLVISEIMQNPAAVSDTDGEYFEVYNFGSAPVQMMGMVIKDIATTNTHTIASSVIVAPGAFAALARNSDSGANGGFTAAYEYSNVFLGNGTDAVVLETADGDLIDVVAYDNGATFPDPNGASMQLDPNSLNPTANDNGANWCESNLTFGDGDLGTPGTLNNACGMTVCAISNVILSVQAACDGADADFQLTFDVIGGSGQYEIYSSSLGMVLGQFLGGGANGTFFINGTIPGPTTPGVQIVTVRDVNDNSCIGNMMYLAVPECPIVNCVNPGAVIITEIMQNPSAVGDNSGEWFEVYNTTNAPIDMQGWVIKDNDNDSHIIASSVVVPANDFAVFGNNSDMGTNGGVALDYDYNGSWFLSNGADEVILECGTSVIDQVFYDGGSTFPDPTGASMSLDPGSFNAMANDNGANWCEGSTPYGAGDLGTPGAANPTCCEAPTAICANTTVTLDGTGFGFISGNDIDGGSIVECGLQSMFASPNTFDCDDLGPNLVTLTVTDQNGDTDQCTATVTVEKGDMLPPGWDHDNIGGATGDAGFDSCEDVFCVESNGISFPTTDKVHYAYKYMCGNGDIIARVASVSNGGLGGIMIRESLAAGSKKVAMRTHLNGSFFVQRDVRTATNGFSSTQQIFAPGHDWLRIVRNGNQFIGYISPDGYNWRFAFFALVPMNSCVLVGLYAEGPRDNATTVACFDNVQCTGGQIPTLTENNSDYQVADQNRANVNIYPNPAQYEINVSLQDYLGKEVDLTVYNSIGQAVKVIQLDRVEIPTERIDLPNLEDGIYLLEIRSGNDVTTKKFVISNN